MISDAATVAIAPDVLASELGAEFVMLSLKDGIYYGLDEVGGRVWKLAQTQVTVREICQAITEEYDVEHERCRRDVLNLLADLLTRGLIEVRDPA